jgi:hypothetical protein
MEAIDAVLIASGRSSRAAAPPTKMTRASSDIGRAVFMDDKWPERELVPLRESGWRISATATSSAEPPASVHDDFNVQPLQIQYNRHLIRRSS